MTDAGHRSRLAVVDLGSNSFRLVVFAEADGWWKRTDEIHEAVRIGEGLGDSDELGREPMMRALATIDVFMHFCRAGGLETEEIDAVATSAIRDASNAQEFLTRARASGLPIRVLDREQEARYGYLAAVNSTTLADGAMVDLGGGSLQLVRVDGRLAREFGSWPLGAVRMTERFLPGKGPAKRRRSTRSAPTCAVLGGGALAGRRGPAPGRRGRRRPQPGRGGPARRRSARRSASRACTSDAPRWTI